MGLEVGLWHLLRRFILTSRNLARCAMVYTALSSSGEEGRDSTHLCPEITNGRSSLREEVAHVWNVGLSKAEETLPCFLHSLFHCLALGFRG